MRPIARQKVGRYKEAEILFLKYYKVQDEAEFKEVIFVSTPVMIAVEAKGIK